MTRRTSPSADDWRNISDAKQRKKIQDRLAQRARRQRLREAKNSVKRRREEGETRKATDPQREIESSTLVPKSTIDLFSLQSLFDIVPVILDEGPLNSRSPSSTEDLSYKSTDDLYTSFYPNLNKVPAPPLLPQLDYPLTVYGALYMNGSLLNIPCSTVVPSRSTAADPSIPLSLHPTELQLITIHPRWIDRFPFPKLRNSIISLSGVVDDEEFLKDICCMPSFVIEPGTAPWDPRGWKMKRVFAEKWGYLFF